jgi:Holliday junction resolvase RusA-like endonuclease
MGKPRMTQRDRWKKRPVVLRYHDYCDRIRAAALEQLGELPPAPIHVKVAAYIALPPSWSKKKRLAMLGRPHRARPDWDNIGKAICDALLEEDSCLSGGTVDKFWCWDENRERTEVTLFYEHPLCPRCQSIMIGGLCQNYGCSSS